MADEDPYKVSSVVLQELFHEHIRPMLFDGIQPSGQRRAILVGGQPGAGKSRLLHEAITALGGYDVAVPINGDDLRGFHPNFNAILRDRELDMAYCTSSASNAWVEMAIRYAADHGINVAIEGTFRNPKVPLRTAEQLVAAGFRVECWAVAISLNFSRLAVIERYLLGRDRNGWGRWVHEHPQVIAYDAMPDTVVGLAVSAMIDVVSVRRRDNTIAWQAGPPDSHTERLRRGNEAHAVLLAERDRTVYEYEALVWLDSYENCIVLANQTDAPSAVFEALSALDPIESSMRDAMTAGGF